MSQESAQVSFRELLLVSEGPPPAAWHRALKAARGKGIQRQHKLAPGPGRVGALDPDGVALEMADAAVDQNVAGDQGGSGYGDHGGGTGGYDC